MKMNFLKLLLVLTLFLGMAVFFHLRKSSADVNKFNNVVTFSTVNGLVGFFNQNDGKVYLYDGNLQNCVFVTQIEELGKPMKFIENK